MSPPQHTATIFIVSSVTYYLELRKAIPMGGPKGFRRPADSLLLWAPKMLNCQLKLDKRKYTL